MLSLQLVVFFLSFSSALSIHARRDVPSLLNDLASVSSKTNTLASAVNNYNGDLFSLGPVSSAETAVEKAIEKATKTAFATPIQADPESKIVLQAAQDIVPNVVTALNALKAKKPVFQKIPFVQQTVLNDLKKLRASSAELTQAVVKILAGDQSLDAPAADVRAKIDMEFAAAIDVFQAA